MNQLITDIFKSLCPFDLLTVLEHEEGKEHTQANLEKAIVVYSPTIGTKGYHLYDYNGKKIKYNSEAFQPNQATEFIHDGICFARTQASIVYLLFEVTESTQPFLEYVLKAVLPPAIELALEKRKHFFKVAFAKAVDTKVKEYKSNIEENERDADSKELELLELRRKVVADHYALRVIDGTVGQWKTKAEAEYDHLMKLVPNLYQSIELEQDDLVTQTDMIYIYHHGFEYEIGEFEIRINLATGDLNIHNRTKQIEGCYDHPHINDGASCLGNIGKGIIKMLTEFELFGVLQLVHNFLNSYNPASPYKKIEFWDPDYVDEEENRYESCHEESSGYTCVECGDDNCPFYQYAFETCLENSSLSECMTCDYQCHLGRERIREHEEERELVNV